MNVTQDSGLKVLNKVIGVDNLLSFYAKVPTEAEKSKKHTNYLWFWGVTLIGTITLAFVFIMLGTLLHNRKSFIAISFACSGAFIVEVLLFILWSLFDDSYETNTDISITTDKAKKFTKDTVSLLFGYTANGDTYTLITDKQKKLFNQISNLLMFCYLIGKSQDADNIVNSFTHLQAAKKALVQAYIADALGYDTTKEIKVEYKRELFQIRDQLYKLCLGDINKLIFVLFKHNQFDYLPKDLQKKYVKNYNNKLLADLKQDCDIN